MSASNTVIISTNIYGIIKNLLILWQMQKEDCVLNTNLNRKFFSLKFIKINYSTELEIKIKALKYMMEYNELLSKIKVKSSALNALLSNSQLKIPEMTFNFHYSY